MAGRRRSFSVELDSKEYVRNVTITDNSIDRVLLEGELGDLTRLSMIESEVLEIAGRFGTIRIDVTRSELKVLTNEPPVKVAEERSIG